MAFPFEKISGWIREPANPCPSLKGDQHADVVVIGAGYTGLSAALSLREQGVDVLVLERDFAGAGASGRNAGHLTPTIGKDLPTLLRMFGEERAQALVRFADEAVEHTEHVIERLRIECGYEPNGNILASVHPKHEKRLREAATVALRLGGQVRFLSSDEMRERGLPRAFLCGVLEKRGGLLDPGRYVTALRKAAIDAGVRLHEHSTVQSIDKGKPVRVHCDGGTVSADSAVVATNAYSGVIGFMPRKVVPLRVSLFETEPLGTPQLAAIGWNGREGIYTSHEVLESYRLTARNTIIGGSKVVRYAYGGKLAEGYDPGTFQIIENAFRERFPELEGIPVQRFWGGWIGLTLDFLPMIGVVGDQKNVHYGFGYAGHGVAQATLTGSILADRVVGRAHECEKALARRLWSWPLEPLRYAAYQAITRTLYAVDARTDRQARKLWTEKPAAPRRASV
ncbi:MAG: FAD-binding oxidoreductase [Deltaproteobacteria bacterium]|nr:FAD-binding oxidoreductase [Deltaproteobacteria bacterium]